MAGAGVAATQRGTIKIVKFCAGVRQYLLQAVTDRERKELARKEFSNPVMSNPGQPLTFHGFKRRRSGLRSR